MVIHCITMVTDSIGGGLVSDGKGGVVFAIEGG